MFSFEINIPNFKDSHNLVSINFPKCMAYNTWSAMPRWRETLVKNSHSLLQIFSCNIILFTHDIEICIHTIAGMLIKCPRYQGFT